MPEPPDKIAWLREEASHWVNEGLIDESQREKIVARYPAGAAAVPPPLKRERSAKSRLPAVLIGLAVLLIGIGLILFYAANWREMTPSVKLAQVFALLVVTYGAGAFFHFKRHPWKAAGRGLILLGLVCFGAAIGLVAQIYHISAHPTKGVLLWATAATLVAALMRERWALYLAFLLVLVWDIWERSVFGSVNYAMFPVLALLYGLSAWIKSHLGRFAAVILAILWFYEVNFHYLGHGRYGDDLLLIFVLMQIPFGAFLIASALVLGKPLGTALATTVRLIGWLAIYFPLIALSWPFEPDTRFVWKIEGASPYLLEFGLLTAVAAVLTVTLMLRREPVWRFPAIALAAGVALILLPLGAEGVMMASMMVALILFHASTLLSGAHSGLPGTSVLARILVLVTMTAHSFGHFSFGFDNEQLTVCGGLSGLFFIGGVFLFNEWLSTRDNSQWKGSLLRWFCVGQAYVLLYIASFFSLEQASFFDASERWLLATEIVTALTVALWIFLFLTRPNQRRLLAAAGLPLLTALVIMLLPGTAMPPTLRQILLNSLLFFLAGAVIVHAVGRNSTALVNVAILAVVLHLLTRYFDVFWDMLYGSLFFLVTGVVLFAVAAFMEWQRRRLIQRMRRQATQGTGEITP